MGKEVQKILNILSYIYMKREQERTQIMKISMRIPHCFKRAIIFSPEKVQRGTLRDFDHISKCISLKLYLQKFAEIINE